MANTTPKARLSKLFHKQNASASPKDESSSSPPPVSPGSPSNVSKQSSMRRSLSRTSLRVLGTDVLHSKGSDSQSPTSPNTSDSKGRHARNRSSMASLRDIMAGGHSDSKPRREPQHVEESPSPAGQAVAQAAATKAMYPEKSVRLPSIAHESNLSDDMQHLTLAEAAGQTAPGENVANDNITKRSPRKLEVRTAQAVNDIESGAMGRGNVKPLVPNADRYSEDVANWNIVHNNKPTVGDPSDLPAPLKVRKRSSVDGQAGSLGSPISPVSSGESHGLSRKPDYNNLRNSTDMARSGGPAVPARSAKRSLDGGRPNGIPRRSLEKPLPARPSDEYAEELQDDPVIRNEPGTTAEPSRDRQYLVKDSTNPIDLAGIVDLSNTTDTTLHEKWAPAVTHETVIKETHEIREEVITREFHHHHVFHRILPIVDIEVLPARHFIPVEGGYAEIAEEEVPGQAGAHAQWVIAETVSKMLPQSKGTVVPQHFTARKFEGTEGDYKEYIGSDGVKRTEQWWVHPPTLETGGQETGQTYPFYIGSPNPADDGLRARLPEGKVIGVSPLLAKKLREKLQKPVEVQQGEGDVPPPVPKHRIMPAELADAARSRPVG